MLVRKHALSTFIIRPLVHIYQKEKIAFMNSFGIFREFYIINPTDMDLNFIWTREDPSDSRSGPANFTCTPTTGLIESGKKIHMRFEYISNDLDLTESFWRFFIQEHNISLPFLLVGHTTEPAVSLDRSHFNFREILVGKISFIETIVNIMILDRDWSISVQLSSRHSS
jgi:hydrocephalus-inducing protein